MEDEQKIMMTVAMYKLDSPLWESELLNLRIIASKKAFPVTSIIESVSTLLKGHEECLYENHGFFDDSDFNEGVSM